MITRRASQRARATRAARPSRLGAFGLVLALVVAGACGGDDDAGQEPTDPSETTQGPDDGDDGGPDTDPAVPEPSASGGEVIFAATGETASLDPLDHNRASTASFPLHMFFDPLTEFTPEGDIVPFLAESVEPNDDYSVWTVTLPAGVVFHDGTPLDADAVIYSVQRFRDDERGQSVYGVTTIDEMTAVDDLTIEFSLTESWVGFPGMLALTPGYPVSPTALEEMGRDEFALRGAVGTGPFVLEERVIDSQTVGVRNENYWVDDQPYLDSFVFRPITDSETRFASIQSGDVDAMQTNIGRQIARAQEDPELEVAQFQGNGGNSVVFNLRSAPVDDVRVRRALAHAINRDAMDQVLYDGTMERACGPFTAQSVWYVETECNDYDPDLARELLAEYTADTGNEVVIEFLCSTNAGLPEQTELLSSFWTAVGAEVNIDQVDPAQQLERVRADPPQFQTMCWFGDFNADPDERLRVFYHSEESGAIRDGYSNPRVDEAFDAARNAESFEERYERYATIQHELAEDLPHIYWTSRLDAVVHTASVGGIVVVPGGGFWPGRIWIEE